MTTQTSAEAVWSRHRQSLTTEALWQRYRQTGSLQDRDKLAELNRKLVCKIANRVAKQCPEPVEDLIQLGEIGLLKAIDRYDPDRGNAFSSFAVPWIQGEMQHFLRDDWQHLKIPRRAFEEASKVKRAQRQMAKAGREVTAEVAAAGVGIEHKRWTWISEAVQRKQLAALDEVAEVANEPEEDRDQLFKLLRREIAKLSELQIRCLTEHYFQALSVEAIARRESLTVVEVQAILTQATDKLRHNLEGVYHAEQ